MSVGNAGKYAPSRQARLQAGMQDPEWLRRRELYRKAKGKFLGYFDSKKLVAEWNREWTLSGRKTQPDFPEWLELNRQRLIDKKEYELDLNGRVDRGPSE